MGHTRICDARKRYAWQLIQRSVRYADIRDRITKRFGTQHGPISNGALTDIKAAATLTGDPCFASPLIRSGKTLTYAQKRTILDALLEECTTTTAELSARLRAVETSARTRFCHSTIDDAIRAAYFTLKRVTVYNARRDPFESAQARRAIGCYDVRCVLVLDASHIASDEAQRRQGRAPRGARALCSAYPCSGNQLLSVLGAMSIDGMEMAACDVVVRARSGPARPPACVSHLRRALFCRRAASTSTATSSGWSRSSARCSTRTTTAGSRTPSSSWTTSTSSTNLASSTTSAARASRSASSPATTRAAHR